MLQEMEAVDRDPWVCIGAMALNSQELIFDDLHAVAYKGSSLARTVLGTPDNINKITRADLINYVQHHCNVSSNVST